MQKRSEDGDFEKNRAEIMSNKKAAGRILSYLGILGILLFGLSRASVLMNRSVHPLFNYATSGIFAEEKESIDVLTIGDSDVYSGLIPAKLWELSGITSFSWGEPAQRPPETYSYLKKIYQEQKPQVVFIDVNHLFRDEKLSDNLDSITRAAIEKPFPVVLYHRKLDSFKSFLAQDYTITKGYLYRDDAKKPKMKKNHFKETGKITAIHPITRWYLERSVELCRKNGSSVVLLYIPTYKEWTYSNHNAVMELGSELGLPVLDLNLEMQEEIDWGTDTADYGYHLNYSGAQKVTDRIAKYLEDNYDLEDHRGDPAYQRWQKDSEAFRGEVEKEILEKERREKERQMQGA